MRSGTYQTSYAGLVALSNQSAPWWWAGAGLVALALMPAWFGSHGLSLLAAIFVASIGVLGLNLLSGVAGQISLGHAGFLLIGAYAQAILTTDYKLPTLLANSLGSYETTLMRLVTGYAEFVNGGKKVSASLVDRIQDRHGKTI